MYFKSFSWYFRILNYCFYYRTIRFIKTLKIFLINLNVNLRLRVATVLNRSTLIKVYVIIVITKYTDLLTLITG